MPKAERAPREREATAESLRPYIPRKQMRWRLVSADDPEKVWTPRKQGAQYKLYMGQADIPEEVNCSKVQALLQYQVGSKKITLHASGSTPVVAHTKFGDKELSKPDSCQLSHADSFTLMKDTPHKFIVEAFAEEVEVNVRRLNKEEKAALAEAELQKQLAKLPKDDNPENWKYRILFPVLPPKHFQYEPEKAVEIGCKAIHDFLQAHQEQKIRLVLFERKQSEALKLFKKRWAETYGDQRLGFMAGEIWKPRKQAMPSRVIVNAADTRFSNGNEVSAAIYRAAGKDFARSTLDKLDEEKDPEVGEIYVVDVNPACKLAVHGVEHAIHVLPPNLNPCWPGCIEDEELEQNPDKADKALDLCYRRMLDEYYKLIFQRKQ
eukprot:NODE_2943_length_1310_cov_101.146588_g2794_i0.p1 GENE.NODE_2943_length_1310_cov_101.146588_g2794_i0~~NODE_2943_length_1310_cov_101.146588_g2794_i0.p1  ORF type:complete len:398 (-),score=69.89 NODE_2943_length_1310_cov_101.146588_g2794_i0:116-1249(-)